MYKYKRIRQMLMAIFLMLLSVWCLVYADMADPNGPLLYIGLILPVFAVWLMYLGFFEKSPPPSNYEDEDRKNQ